MIDILFSDRSAAVAVKPAGVHSQPSADGRGEDMLSLLSKQLGGDFFPIHRLDLGTEGVMVFARTKKAAASLSRAVQEGKLNKEYEALVHGTVSPAEGEMTDLLFHSGQTNKTFVVDRMRGGAKEAKLLYRVLSSREEEGLGPVSLVRIRLLTGRTHQIRAQFSHRGYPLVGDGKYGAKDHEPFPRLRAAALSFPHPDTGKVLSFSLPETNLLF